MRAAAIFGLNASEKDLRPFQKSSDATWQIGVPQSPNDTDAILIFGGDGTIHRHLAELVRLQIPVLVVPCGSGNDFARALQLRNKKDALTAWREFISDRKPLAIDLGVITDPSEHQHYFCCVGGVGLDAEVARRANHLPPWLRAYGGYALSLLPTLLRFHAVQTRITPPTNDETHFEPTILAAFANAPTYGGGMKIAPNARLDDGQLDLCIIRDIDPFKLFCLFPTIYFGHHLRLPEVEYLQTPRLRIETEHPLDVYADGEYVCQTPVEITVARAVLPVIVHSSQTGF
jgi:diacylglycerol kinase (ATP)